MRRIRERLARWIAPQAVLSPVIPPTIELKPNIMVTPPPKEPRSKWKVAGLIVAATMPIAISFFALAVSYLALRDQRQVDVSAAATAKQHDAAQVSYWPDFSKGALIVENLSSQNMGQVIFWPLSGRPDEQLLTIPDLRPCSINTVEQVSETGKIEPLDFSFLMGGTLSGGFSELTFSDPSGQIWVRTSRGNLSRDYEDATFARAAQQAEQPLDDPPVGTHLGVISFKPANYCG